MSISWQVLRKNVFLISSGGRKQILYAPLQGVVMEVNQAYVDRFREALNGNTGAAAALGLDMAVLDRFAEAPADAECRINPQWPDSFEPTDATVFLTHKCTLRCTYCYCHGGEGVDMPWPVFERTVRFALDNAKRQKRDFTLAFHGGDVGACWPLFRQCIEFIEEKCEEAGVGHELTIGTNGFYSEEQAAYIARHVKSATVSIDGPPEVHDLYRPTAAGQPSLARVLDAVRAFDEHGMNYSVRMTVAGQSVARLPECVEFICQNTRAQSIRAEPLYSRGRAAGAQLASPDHARFIEAFRAAHSIARKHQRGLAYSGARLVGVFCSFCAFPSPTFGVTPEGHLTCCYEVLHPGDPLRSLFFYGHIPPDGSAIVVDQQRVAAIRSWAKRRRDACAGCFCVFACAGDCAAKVMDSGSNDATPERCHITRALVYDMLCDALSSAEGLPRPLSAVPAAASPVPACACVDGRQAGSVAGRPE